MKALSYNTLFGGFDGARRDFLGQAPHTGQNTAIFVEAPVRALSAVTDEEHVHYTRLTVTAEVPGFGDPVSLIGVHLRPNAAHVRRREHRMVGRRKAAPTASAFGVFLLLSLAAGVWLKAWCAC